jgi:hypothetical protein
LTFSPTSFRTNKAFEVIRSFEKLRGLTRREFITLLGGAAALARNVLVIPVLVDGTHMPKASELPDSLKPLSLRNAIQLRQHKFRQRCRATDYKDARGACS